MKKIELAKIISFNKLVDTLKLDKLSGKEKYELLKTFRKIKLVANEFEGFKQDIINKYISTDECKEMLQKADEGDEEAKKYVDNVNSEVNHIVYMELTSEKEVDIEALSEELFINFLDSNEGLKVSDTLLLEDILL